MDNFFIDSIGHDEEDKFWDLISGDISDEGGCERIVSVLNRSAFRAYMKEKEQRKIMSPEMKVNVKKRMVNLLIKNWEEKKNAVAPEKERCRRHMMKERTRRETQKQNYLALHSLLPCATKNDKTTIVGTAVDEIRRLQRLKIELERRIKDMEARSDNDEKTESTLRFKVKEPVSGIDSLVEVLQCLKSMGTKLKTVQASFSPREFSATMNIETDQMRVEEVEKRVERKLEETQWKPFFLPETSFYNY